MNLFELFVRIDVDDQASKNIDKINKKLGKGLKTAAKIGTAAVGAAATGIAALTKSAVENYAEYEQLVGGVETLFGAGGKSIEEYAASTGRTIAEAQSDYDALMRSQAAVIENAANAYKNAGMSANEYMSTVTSFSASLLQSLGEDTEAAAEYADRAVTDMSDNANKMGTSMEMIQNAYQGFAKQNYTMLDNLKLGYGGTKTEMERLIADAAALTDIQSELGVTVDANSLSFGNIVNAISVMQAKMGIAGTTTEEASKTISGSINAMKGAWSNLITGIADENANIDELISNFTETVGTASDNLIPIISKSIFGLVDLFDKLVPRLIEEMPSTISELAPKIVEIGMNIITMLADGFTNNQVDIAGGVSNTINFLIETLIKLLPKIVEVGMTLVFQLVVGLISAIPQLLMAVPQLIDALISGMIDSSDKFAQQGTEFVDAIMEGILKAWGNFKTWFNNLWDSFFSQRTVDVTVNTNGSHAGGLPYVPFDGYVAELHKGERVLTASEARQYNKGFNGNGSGITIVQNIQAVPQTPVEFASATAAYFEQARWAMA